MSIAITTIIKPSRLFFFLLMFINLLCLVSLFWSIFLVKNSSSNELILVFIVAVVWVGSFFFQRQYLKQRRIVQLSISSKGRLILRELDENQNFTYGERVELISGSVLWSFLMMVHLKSQQGHKIILPIFFDSVDKDTFRRLSVAFHWLMIRLNAG